MTAPRVPPKHRPSGGPAEGKGHGRAGPFVCPFCRAELTWEGLGSLEAEVTIYVREKIYYCPECRAFLGVSSWHTEG